MHTVHKYNNDRNFTQTAQNVPPKKGKDKCVIY